jgi:hypothetical protein
VARRFLESARRDGDPVYAAYVLVLVCGLRKGEVLGSHRDQGKFHLAFVAESRAVVDALFAAAVAAGVDIYTLRLGMSSASTARS